MNKHPLDWGDPSWMPEIVRALPVTTSSGKPLKIYPKSNLNYRLDSVTTDSLNVGKLLYPDSNIVNHNPTHVIVDFEPHGRIFWHSVRTMVASCPPEELTSDPITTTWLLFNDVVRNIYDETQFSKDPTYFFGTLQTLPILGLVTLGRYLETSRPEQAKFLRNETIKLGLALHQSLHAVGFLQPDNYLLDEIKIGYLRFRLANDLLRG